AYLLFGETFTGGQFVGVAVLLAGLFGLAAYNLRTITLDRETLPLALGLAVLTGVTVASYTTFDAYGMRATFNPFTFLMWFFVIDSWFMPALAVRRWSRMVDRPAVLPIVWRGILGGCIALFSFGSIMMATRLDKVGEAAVLRETSAVFAALIGWALLKETVGPIRAGLMALIALGAVIVEFAG
ncbi:MAG: EamA family transporter, partial [Pseudomonadota bacterium]